MFQYLTVIRSIYIEPRIDNQTRAKSSKYSKKKTGENSKMVMLGHKICCRKKKDKLSMYSSLIPPQFMNPGTRSLLTWSNAMQY